MKATQLLQPTKRATSMEARGMLRTAGKRMILQWIHRPTTHAPGCLCAREVAEPARLEKLDQQIWGKNPTQKKAELPIKARVSWVPGTYIICIYIFKQIY